MATRATNKAKGAAWEKAVAEYVGGERRRTHGEEDLGDVGSLPGVVIECKAQNTITLSTWSKELQTEVDNDVAELGLLAVKRTGSTKAHEGYWLIDPRHVPYVIRLHLEDVERSLRRVKKRERKEKASR